MCACTLLAPYLAQPVFWTSCLSLPAGEMVFPWMFDEFAELRKIKEAANLLAADAGGASVGCLLGCAGCWQAKSSMAAWCVWVAWHASPP